MRKPPRIEHNSDVQIFAFGDAMYGRRFLSLTIVRPPYESPVQANRDEEYIEHLRCRVEPGGTFTVIQDTRSF